MATLAFMARWFIGLVFLTSALEKLDNWRDTEAAVAAYGILARRFSRSGAFALVTLESLLALMLLSGLLPQPGSGLAAATFITFGAAIGYRMRAVEGKARCGCGGIFGDRELSWGLVVRSGLLGSVALLGATSAVSWPTEWLPSLLAATGVALLIWLYTTLIQAWEATVRYVGKIKE